ncbi:hypothetical protein [Amycolatopsis sp. H20-H5]|uniref:hypothetical protein n=1 Tax=Amycolatopsis sp. H20-H5 TaxID=3046309 RepID=UPI002DBFC7D7|nr:hypothetical protein [Amycolatopsis sp. H20-H5]MEC3981399.1 hypothetical protein [Amycolatopsis sp. H20-H5]
MSDDLTVPETMKLLARHGFITGFTVWSKTYDLPPTPVSDGWELVELSGYGWILRLRRGGRELSEAAYADESQACAALLAALLGGSPSGAAARERPEDVASLRARWACTPWRHSLSTREQLQAALSWLGVPESAYSLYGGGFQGRLCLEERDNGWRVYRFGDGERGHDRSHADETAACQEFWRRLVDDELPTMLGVDVPVVPAPSDDDPGEQSDLTIPEVLAIWDRRGVVRPVGIVSRSHGLNLPGPAPDDVTHLHELPDGRWELRYTERGRTSVAGRYDREGDVCGAVLGSGVSSDASFASATGGKLADRFANTSYDRLLYYWRLRPWRREPANRDELATLLRDCGFPSGSYHLAGGRALDVLTIEERVDHWRVYRVDDGLRRGEARFATEREACSAFWRRAVDEVLPGLVR